MKPQKQVPSDLWEKRYIKTNHSKQWKKEKRRVSKAVRRNNKKEIGEVEE